jgi:hypothetical protein
MVSTDSSHRGTSQENNHDSRSQRGRGETLRAGLEALVEETNVQELIIASAIFDHDERPHSCELIVDCFIDQFV